MAGTRTREITATNIFARTITAAAAIAMSTAAVIATAIAGSAAAATSTTPTTATGVLQDGLAAAEWDGVIAGCLPDKPGNTAAGATCMRGAVTTTITMTVGASSSAGRP